MKYKFKYTQEFINQWTNYLSDYYSYTQERIDVWFNCMDRNPQMSNCQYMDRLYGGDVFSGGVSFCGSAAVN